MHKLRKDGIALSIKLYRWGKPRFFARQPVASARERGAILRLDGPDRVVLGVLGLDDHASVGHHRFRRRP